MSLGYALQERCLFQGPGLCLGKWIAYLNTKNKRAYHSDLVGTQGTITRARKFLGHRPLITGLVWLTQRTIQVYFIRTINRHSLPLLPINATFCCVLIPSQIYCLQCLAFWGGQGKKFTWNKCRVSPLKAKPPSAPVIEQTCWKILILPLCSVYSQTQFHLG